MNTKTVLMVLGGIVAAVGIADLLLGNTTQSILPTALSDKLTQQSDVAAVVGGAALAYFAYNA